MDIPTPKGQSSKVIYRIDVILLLSMFAVGKWFTYTPDSAEKARSVASVPAVRRQEA
jgi:hypothetical protein